MKKQMLAAVISAAFATPAFAVEVSDQLEVTGEIKAIYGHYKSNGVTTKGIATQAATLGAVIKPNDKFDITTSLLYEEEVDEIVTPAEFDQAFITAHVLPDEKLDIAVGKQYLPFGKFETAMVHDPVTLDFGEGWSDETLIARSKRGNVTTHAFGFRGQSGQKGNYGVGISYDDEEKGRSVGMDYLANLSAPDNFAGVNNANNNVPGIALHGSTKLTDKVTVFGEHILATKKFDNGINPPVKPSATHIETQVDLGKDRMLAVSWEGSKDANDDYFGGLPKNAYGLTYHQPLYKQLFGAVEVKKSKAYDGTKTDMLTGQLSYEF